MSIIQIFLVVFALFALVRTLSQFRHGHVGKSGMIFWAVFWIVVGVVSVTPKTTDIIAKVVGVGRGADLAIYLSLIILFFLMFRIFVKIEHIERDITTVVREIALKNPKDEDKK